MTNNSIMADFTSDLKFTVWFLIGALLINTFLGSKVLYGYLVLVLLSMVAVNGAKISEYLRGLN
jgi:hypothetical protein